MLYGHNKSIFIPGKRARIKRVTGLAQRIFRHMPKRFQQADQLLFPFPVVIIVKLQPLRSPRIGVCPAKLHTLTGPFNRPGYRYGRVCAHLEQSSEFSSQTVVIMIRKSEV